MMLGLFKPASQELLHSMPFGDADQAAAECLLLPELPFDLSLWNGRNVPRPGHKQNVRS